ncbi:CSS-motif domain-containing protein [Shigella flexneri]
MRRLSYSYRYIQEVLYLQKPLPQSSSLEKKDRHTFPPAMKVNLRWILRMANTQNDLASCVNGSIGSEHYIVMVNLGSFIDVIPFGSWPIEVTIIGNARRRGCQ